MSFFDTLKGIGKIAKPFVSAAKFIPIIGQGVSIAEDAVKMGVGMAEGIVKNKQAKKAAKKAATQAPQVPGAAPKPKKKKPKAAVVPASVAVRPLDPLHAAHVFKQSMKPELDAIGHSLRVSNLQAEITHEHRQRMRRERLERALLKRRLS